MKLQLSQGETHRFVPTPKNEPREAQLLIQIIDEGRYLWVDHTAIDLLRQLEYNAGRKPDTRTKINFLVEEMTLDKAELFSRLEHLASRDRAHNKAYFVLIRCPDALPYHYATSVIEKLVGNPRFEYGCVSGTLEEILASKNIRIEGNVLEINF